MNMKEILPNIYEYNDFRKYLSEYQKERQSIDRKFNKSNVSKLIGLPNTRSYFTDVLKGKTVTKSFIERFIGVLELDEDEAQYFRVLVKFNQAENSSEREIYFEQLISLNKTPKKVLDKRIYLYYKNWYTSAIRAILNIYDFNGNYKNLAQKVFPNITTKQAKESLELLVKLNLVSKNRDGFYKPTDNSISTPEYVKHELIKQYQMKCLDLAKTAIIKNRSIPQTIATNMLSVSDEGYKRIEKKIHKFRAEIRSLVHKDESKAEKVYQLNVLLFPNSK